jgi:hypothetical protein
LYKKSKENKDPTHSFIHSSRRRTRDLPSDLWWFVSSNNVLELIPASRAAARILLTWIGFRRHDPLVDFSDKACHGIQKNQGDKGLEKPRCDLIWNKSVVVSPELVDGIDFNDDGGDVVDHLIR